jgi:hypothetical protein
VYDRASPDVAGFVSQNICQCEGSVRPDDHDNQSTDESCFPKLCNFGTP